VDKQSISASVEAGRAATEHDPGTSLFFLGAISQNNAIHQSLGFRLADVSVGVNKVRIKTGHNSELSHRRERVDCILAWPKTKPPISAKPVAKSGYRFIGKTGLRSWAERRKRALASSGVKR